MKKTFFLTFIIMFTTFLLMACRSDTRIRLDGVLDEFATYWAVRAVDFDAIDGPIPLPSGSIIEPGAVIVWHSLNPEIVSDRGEIFQPAYQPVQARIQVTILIETNRRLLERTHIYTVTVMPLENSFEVIFISAITPWQTVVTVASGSLITLPDAPTEAAFDFIGWRKQGTDLFEDFTLPLPGPAIYEAVWVDTVYDVTFDSQGGTPVDRIIDVIHSTTLVSILVPTREGYTFLGWIFMDAHGNEQLLVEDRTLINQDIHAVALWIPKP